ncbi:NIPSNAP protein [Flavobacteriaceae bacterium MAR_2010_188]|nr:NIPSNAP protein [Flavobacteriaceae bacterium MAR_2010_188]
MNISILKMMTTRLLPILLLFCSTMKSNAQQQVYELRTYELEFSRSADILHNYFEKALIPALNRQGVSNIGAFEEEGQNLPQKIYLLIPYNDISQFSASSGSLNMDEKYLQDAKDYINVTEQTIPYKRYSTSLIKASSGFPNLVKPEDGANLFELRIYESRNEDALRRKVKMFNDSEFGIFAEVGLPMVFFGENIAGSQMPCLTYMLAFNDKANHDEAWSKFGPHPEWQRITKLEEYKDSMNDITRVFLKPLSYSQL